eukprot:Rhum_TRINITY_DN14117_c6_g1::Rhum_TRINITY_DN14117_c6_g1_i1::g.72110::m.72110
MASDANRSDRLLGTTIPLGVLSNVSNASSMDGVDYNSDAERKRTTQACEILTRDTIVEFRQAAMDAWRVRKDKQLCASSISCLVLMITQSILIWQLGTHGDIRHHTVTIDRDRQPELYWIVMAMDILKGLLTLLSIVFLVQYYKKLYGLRREKYLRAIRHTPGCDGDNSALETPTRFRLGKQMRNSSGFDKDFGKWLMLRFIAEVAVHLVLPFDFVMRNSVAYQLLLLGSFSRLYLVARLLHTSSPAFRRRGQIQSQYQDFRRMSLKVSWGLTIKISFYKYMWTMVTASTLTILFVLAFVIYVLERDTELDNPDFQELGNCFYFAFITFSTIGFGDMHPKSSYGKVIAILLGVLGHVILATFGGIITNKLAPSKTQQLVTEYLENQDAETNYRHAAALLIQSVWRVWGSRKARLARMKMAANASASVIGGSIGGIAAATVQSSFRSKVLGTTLDPQRKTHAKSREMVFQAVKKFRHTRYMLAKSSLQAIDPVVDQKLDQMCQVLESHSKVLNRLVELMDDGAAGASLADFKADTFSPGRKQSISLFSDSRTTGLPIGRGNSSRRSVTGHRSLPATPRGGERDARASNIRPPSRRLSQVPAGGLLAAVEAAQRRGPDNPLTPRHAGDGGTSQSSVSDFAAIVGEGTRPEAPDSEAEAGARRTDSLTDSYSSNADTAGLRLSRVSRKSRKDGPLSPLL